jgi:hypothetical protein
MRPLSLWAVTILALPLIGSADEPGWVAIGPGNGFTQYVNANSLRIRAGRLTASTLTVFAAPQQLNAVDMKPYRSMTTLSMYDCSAYSSGVLDITFYEEAGGRGEALKTIVIKPAAVVMNRSSPGSLGHKEIETVCSIWTQLSKGTRTTAK